MNTAIVDYDEAGYDYRNYWTDRRYESWAEHHALRRLAPRLGTGGWFVDLGGGFGRNAEHYREEFERYAVVDYSATNLTNAARLLESDIRAGRAFLIRADLLRLPFVDTAFDAAMLVRVLHHMADPQAALSEMGRIIGRRWLIDVPIKHHALAMVRSAGKGGPRSVRGPAPMPTGTTANRFWNFDLADTRTILHRGGWESSVVASVNNLRRWDQGLLPAPLTTALTPVARAVETVAQRCGQGWWGPNQFVLAERRRPVPAAPAHVGTDAPAVAARMICPSCHGALCWTAEVAGCQRCRRAYPYRDGYWDFTVAGRPNQT